MTLNKNSHTVHIHYKKGKKMYTLYIIGNRHKIIEKHQYTSFSNLEHQLGGHIDDLEQKYPASHIKITLEKA